MKRILLILIFIIPCIGFGQCIKNSNSTYSIKFGYGAALEYLKSDELNHEIYTKNVNPLLEYIHIYKNGFFDSVYYEWYSNRDVINNINHSVLTLKDGLYYHNDTLYTGNVFFSNYHIKTQYCCDECTPLETLIKKDFLVTNGSKIKNN